MTNKIAFTNSIVFRLFGHFTDDINVDTYQRCWTPWVTRIDLENPRTDFEVDSMETPLSYQQPRVR
jgi:hypothetical protein